MDRAIILASGPSLNDEDISVCKRSCWPVVTVNNTWVRYPECNIIYGGDFAWWREHYKLIKSNAALWSCDHHAALRYNLNHHKVPPSTYNSGMRAIELAVQLGAKHILLLGYDCSLSNGNHWHGNHEKTSNPTTDMVELWKQQFERAAKKLSTEADIINCSRHTELSSFRKSGLLEQLSFIPSASLR